MSIYPNPGAGAFTVDLNGVLARDMKIEVYNSVGQTVLNQTITEATGKLSIDLTGNAAGVYLLKMVSGDMVVTKRLVIK